MVVYSLWMLNAWGQEDDPSAEAPASSVDFVTAQLPNLLAANAFVVGIPQIPAPGPAWLVAKACTHRIASRHTL